MQVQPDEQERNGCVRVSHGPHEKLAVVDGRCRMTTQGWVINPSDVRQYGHAACSTVIDIVVKYALKSNPKSETTHASCQCRSTRFMNAIAASAV
jgi:hypothetical protein